MSLGVEYKKPEFFDVGQDIMTIDQMVDDAYSKINVMLGGLMARRKRGGKIEDDEWDQLADMQKLFKYLQTTYMAMIKMGRIAKADVNPNLDADILNKVRQSQSSIGAIVRKIPGG